MAKIRYEVDPYNRLVSIDRSLSLPKQRRVLEGRFALGSGNSLEYRVKSPSGDADNNPYQVNLKGRWSLSKNHQAVFTVIRSSGGASGDSFEICGDLIDAKGNALLVSLTTRRDDNTTTTYALELTGSWSVDNNNRLIFKLKRGRDSFDPMVFVAAWQLGVNNEIVYRYEKSQLKTRSKTFNTLILKGAWKLESKNSLNYEIDACPGQSLVFKASLSGCSADRVTYEIGTTASGHVKPRMRTISLFGSWRIKKGVGLYFDVTASSGRVSAISFSAEARITPKDTLLFTITDDIKNSDLRMQLELDRRLLGGDGEAFIRMLTSRNGSAVMIGAGFRW